MDSLSQLVLGGAVGEAVLGKKVGNKAILWGAIGGTIPDLDTIPGQFLNTVSRLEIHRGFSHSIVFAILVAPLLGALLNRLYRKKKESDMMGWTWLMFWSIVTHPLLDIFTTWGTQLFWPLDWRIAIQSIFVIDPLYTLPFLLCVISLFFFHRKSKKRAFMNKLGIILSTSYLFLTVLIKLYVDFVFERHLKQNQIAYERFDSRPTPFNSILWTSNIETKEAFWITYYSLLDKDKELEYAVFPKNEHLLQAYRNAPELERLIQLTKGFYTVEKATEGVIMNDLRFGLTEGFDQGKGNFVFRYRIQMRGGKLEIEQEQQSFKGAERVLKKLGQRILGK